jgi:hypothetical protein
LAGKPKNKVVSSKNRLCLNLTRAASEMSLDDFDGRNVVFRAKAGKVLIFFDYYFVFNSSLNFFKALEIKPLSLNEYF